MERKRERERVGDSDNFYNQKAVREEKGKHRKGEGGGRG